MTDAQSPQPAELADAAYEALRALNHATIARQAGFNDSDEIYRVLANLTALLRITPQALHQLTRWAASEQRAGRLHAVAGPHEGDGAAAVAAIGTELSIAAAWCARAARRVDQAHQVSADLAQVETLGSL